MVRTISAAALLLVATASSASAQSYPNAPWCAVINTGFDVRWECYYRSVEECTPNVLGGNRGFCNPNPYYQAPAGASRKGRRHKNG